jgi:hypothetical protein
MSDYKNKQPQQSNKPDVEPITKARTSTLSSLSNLPPLTGINHPMKQPAESNPGISQSKDMHQIKAMIDIGLGMYAHNLTFRKHYEIFLCQRRLRYTIQTSHFFV